MHRHNLSRSDEPVNLFIVLKSYATKESHSSNWISSHIHLLICLPSPAFHYNGKFIMQIPEMTS
jgi:hypothetical protein